MQTKHQRQKAPTNETNLKTQNKKHNKHKHKNTDSNN